MKKLCIRCTLALAPLLPAGAAHASGDSGTSAMGEMSLSGGQLALMAGGVAALGGVFWLLAKLMNR